MEENVDLLFNDYETGKITKFEFKERILYLIYNTVVTCTAPECIKPCRHSFGNICQYNCHCNFKKF